MASLWDDLESCVTYAPNSFAAVTGDRGTIQPKANFNATEDAVALKKAMKGLGTTEETLIDILTHRTNAQRQVICKAYLEDTGKTLVQDVKGDTHGHFEKLLVALATPPALYDCQEVRRAMEGVGTDDSILIEIFSSRSNQQIKVLCDVYLKETERKLTFDLMKETTKEFGTTILLLAQGKRDESTQVDAGKAKEDAKALYNAGEKKWGTDEAKFVEILCQRSIPQLRQTLVEYHSLSGKTLQQSIEGEMSGPLEDLLVAIVKCVKSVPAYFAELLHQSMKGGGTDEATLTRIMVSRSEVDLLDIRAEFKKQYQHSLHSAIKSDLSGNLGACLLQICGGDD
ncbi:annexin A3a isoform X1 [Osmerus eperlanus]|uniref:annexin A3a isoform X1 n=1 Tax=Osmerus eperlanus TaxID=29151 RepID=UPI002E14DAA7